MRENFYYQSNIWSNWHKLTLNSLTRRVFCLHIRKLSYLMCDGTFCFCFPLCSMPPLTTNLTFTNCLTVTFSLTTGRKLFWYSSSHVDIRTKRFCFKYILRKQFYEVPENPIWDNESNIALRSRASWGWMFGEAELPFALVNP